MQEIIDKLTKTLQEIEGYHGIVHSASSYDHVKQLHQQARNHVAELRKMVSEAKKITVTPSDNNQRNTHFVGFAKALWKDLLDANGDGYIDIHKWDDPTDTPNYIEVIARRAYDLVLHVLWQTTPASGSTIKKYQGLTIEEIANAIPDLTELPEVQS